MRGPGSCWYGEDVPRAPRAPPLPASPARYHVGLDENGMGPRLGPMIVTSVLAEVDEAGAALVTTRPRGAIAKRAGDSKKLVAFADSALGEAWARAIAARAGAAVATPDALLSAVALDAAEELRRPCPPRHADLCWASEGEAFAADDALVAGCDEDLAHLARRGVRVLRARVAIVCARRLNDGVARGLSRFDLDLHAMERLVLAARGDAGGDLYAHCGKVGGLHFYGDRFGPLAGRRHVALAEGRARSEYLVHGIGRVAFVRDADATNLLVGLASLVGKWARDHLMRRVLRWHRAHDPALPEASGYHDPVTARFVEATALLREEQRLEDACFERLALGREATSSRRPKAPPAATAGATTTATTAAATATTATATRRGA